MEITDAVQERAFVDRSFRALFDELEKWKPLFYDVRDFLNPWLGQFDEEGSNTQMRHDEWLLRTMPIKYAQILASGLQWGITSPTRPWIKLAFPDLSLMDDPDVLTWLSSVESITQDILAKGHFYPENQQAYLELGCFGTSAMFIQEDPETVINCKTFTIGEYAIGVDAKGMPNSFARNIYMTPHQMAEMFGVENCPSNVQRSVQDIQNAKPTKVMHLIVPNPFSDPSMMDKQHMPYREYYYCAGLEAGKYLRIGGYHEFPVTIARWQTKGSDVYGTGPGIWSLGDAKQIQVMWRDIVEAAELTVKPPLQAPSDILANGGVNMLPAAANYYNPSSGSDGGIKPVFEVKLDYQGALAIQQAIEECIKAHFNTSVFQLLSDMDKGTRTAREIVELSAEKMSQMGPLVDRMETDVLPQIVERVLAIGFRNNVYPPAPRIVQGMTMQISYISILSQAQKQSAITPIIDTVNTVISMATETQLPEILDKLNFDEITDQLSRLNGVPPAIVKSDKEVAAIRQARAQQQQAMNQAQMISQGAQVAKTASQADLSGNNALTQVLGGPTGGLTNP
jgi:hypothetical protein